MAMIIDNCITMKALLITSSIKTLLTTFVNYTTKGVSINLILSTGGRRYPS